jgi:hypothetical protein
MRQLNKDERCVVFGGIVDEALTQEIYEGAFWGAITGAVMGAAAGCYYLNAATFIPLAVYCGFVVGSVFGGGIIFLQNQAYNFNSMV